MQLVWMVCTSENSLEYAHHRLRYLWFRYDDNIVSMLDRPPKTNYSRTNRQPAYPALPRRHLHVRRERPRRRLCFPFIARLCISAVRPTDVRGDGLRRRQFVACWSCDRHRYPLPRISLVQGRGDPRSKLSGAMNTVIPTKS